MRNKVLILIVTSSLISVTLCSITIYILTRKEKESETNEIASLKETSENDATSDNSESNLESSEEPASVVKLIFIHHSTGENWLSDEDGTLGKALAEQNYFVSDTNYGWGPDNIGDTTDIGHWWKWFRSPDSTTYLNALYQESDQNSEYTRLESDPDGENEIVMFKSCYPNSELGGTSNDPIPDIDKNLLKGEGVDSQYHTISNVKGIYIDLLEYFKTKQDKLFIVVTAPPLGRNNSDSSAADNARALNNWLKNDWLEAYDYQNVAVFDFYNVLTGDGESNFNEYPSGGGDDHPSTEGNLKATQEFIPFLNGVYNSWKGN